MLTVKHIHDGIETIFEAPHGVEYIGVHARVGPGGLAILNSPSDIRAAEADNLGIEITILTNGHAYVMNADGQTVASYTLPAVAMNAPVVAG